MSIRLVLFLGFSLILSFLVSGAEAGVSVGQLKCEYMDRPLGIDVVVPRLGWIVESDVRGQVQKAYQILVASSPEKLHKNEPDLWDSGKVDSSESVHVEYAGKELSSYMECWWKVRVWDKDGKASAWSEPSRWTIGVLDERLWQGKWLGYAKPDDPKDEQFKQRLASPLLRRQFEIKKPVRSAKAYICGLGYYELRLNGAKVGDHVLDPAFTRYDRRVLYVTHDVTKQLKKGANAVGVMLGNGWLNVHTQAAWNFNTAPWRQRPTVLLQLRIVYADGSVETVTSDAEWKATTGPIVQDGIREGEHYDARKEIAGWDKAGFDDSGWDDAQVMKEPGGRLSAQMMPAIKVTGTITPVKLTEPKPGVFVFDLGQNIAGWAKLKVKGPAGAKVEMRYGERLKPDGTLEQKQIAAHVKERNFQLDTYTLKGDGVEVWEPRFVYHGFQYVEVRGFPGKPTLESICGRVAHTAFESAGEFECSNELLNTIQRLTRWSYRSNFHGYPTDCPHREKNGWTGDAHLAAEQAMYNWHNAAAYTKWMNDFHDEQKETGELPGIVPTGGWGYAWGNGPAWDSAYLIIPRYMHQYLGDERILETHYDRFKRYVDYLTSKANNHIVSIGLGDWVPARTKTPEAVTSTLFYYLDTMITAQTAQMMGKDAEAAKYRELANNIKEAFNKTFYKGDGIYANGSQTALSFALFAGVVPASEKAKTVEQLAMNVEANGYHIDTGILGARCVFNVLSENGRHDVAYKMATVTTEPSYGSWIERGATTLWEDWPGVASLNHIMFGDISAWFYKNLAGIRIDSDPCRVVIRPRPVADLTWAQAAVESVKGTIRSRWRIRGAEFALEVTVPVGAKATVYVPARKVKSVQVDASADLVQPQGMFADYDVFTTGSGNYRFVSTSFEVK